MNVLEIDYIVAMGDIPSYDCVGYHFDHTIQQLTATPNWDGRMMLQMWCTRCDKYMTYYLSIDPFLENTVHWELGEYQCLD